MAIMFIGYIKLILAMSWYQLVYDITLFTVIADVGSYPIEYISTVVEIIGGIGASFMSNWIAFVLFYVVVYKKSFDITKNYIYIILSTVIIWIPIVVIYSIGALPKGSNPHLVTFVHLTLYYYARLISIALNFILIGCILYKNYQIRSKSTTKTPAEIAINTLCRRVMYYPILQTISRSGYAWYEFQYGFDFRVSQAEHDPERYGLLIYSAIITPTVSIGYLILFLYIEPHAYKIFKKIFCGIDTPEQKEEDDDNYDTKSTTSRMDESNRASNQSEIDILDRRLQRSNVYNNSTESENSMYQYGNTTITRFVWNDFRSSITNFFNVQDDDVYDNRTEDEIFAVIDDIPSALSTINLPDKRRTGSRSKSGVSTKNIIHSLSTTNDVILNYDGGGGL